MLGGDILQYTQYIVRIIHLTGKVSDHKVNYLLYHIINKT